MPPKRARQRTVAEDPKKGRSSGKARKKGAYAMPPPLPSGERLTDYERKQWVLGDSVGKGGFGEIYLAARSDASTSTCTAAARHVIKIEPHENGPLFVELSFYRRVAKEGLIKLWVKEHSLEYLPIPSYVGSGGHTHLGTEYRFMVMQRFGEDIERKFESAGRHFGLKTVCYLALRMLEALEFLHEADYVHADLKGSNLLTGHAKSHQHQVYLVDYGLAYHYRSPGGHKPYREDPRLAHDGTAEFTSIDAHKGVKPSRRADIEILGYCLLQWASGRLPWEQRREDKSHVAAQKIKYKDNPSGLLQACFTDGPAPKCLRDYLCHAFSLGYEARPDYAHLKGLFLREMTACGWKDDAKGLAWLEPATAGRAKRKDSPAKRKRKAGPAPPTEAEVTPPKRPRARQRKPVERPTDAAPAQVQRGGRKGRVVEEEEEEEEEEDSVGVARAGRGRRGKKAVVYYLSSDDEEDSVSGPSAGGRRRRGEKDVAYRVSSEEEEEEEEVYKGKRRRAESPGYVPSSWRGRGVPARRSQRRRAPGSREEEEGEEEEGEATPMPVVSYPTQLGYSNGDHKAPQPSRLREKRRAARKPLTISSDSEVSS